MAITVSGMYGLSLEKYFKDTAGFDLEAETNKTMLATNANTPAFDTDAFRSAITEPANSGTYSSGGSVLTGTELTIASGSLTFDATDSQWTSATLSANGCVHYLPVGSAGTDILVYLLNFGSTIASTAGTYTIQYHATGIFIVDYTP